MNMRIVEAQGYSKEKAFIESELDANLDKFRNATISWKKAGAPISGKKLEEFLTAYMKEKKAVGIYLVVTPSSDDTRLRPYTVINEATKGKRKATTTYQIKEADLKVKTKMVKGADEDGNEIEVEEVTVTVSNTGAVEGRATKKDAAVKLMKELIKENRKDYVIEIVKEITEGQKYASYGVYTPSKTAEKGQFIFAAE
jgi:hypothetical protein